MFWKNLLLAMVVSITSGGHATSDTVFLLSDRSVPLVARQEKAQNLLRAWEIAGGSATYDFPLNSDEDLSKVQLALENLLTKADDDLSTAPIISSAAEHYLVWAIARAQMVNQLDFTTASLSHFFHLNSNKYPCEPRATVSELLVPRSYTDAAGTTAILGEISRRLDKETFPRVAYHINDRLGKHGTGFLGEVVEDQAGHDRFSLYREVERVGRKGGGSGDKYGGPFAVPEGWLFVQLHSLVDGTAGCFEKYSEQVAQDYGREWLKKITADTLATATAALKPDVFAYTSGTRLTDPAITVANHTLSFTEAHNTLPFLMGNQREERFWKSVQRQALDVELVYHYDTGAAVRALKEYDSHVAGLRLLASARLNLASQMNLQTTTGTLTEWYEAHKARYTETTAVSYEVFECVTSPAANLSSTDYARCAAALESLRTLELTHSADFATSLAESIPFSVNAVTVHSDKVTSAVFNTLSREIQVACQQASDGEWSPVFSEDGKQKILKVHFKANETKALSQNWEAVSADYRHNFQLKYWTTFFGLE